MRLTNYSDYALRILIYLATVPKPDELATIGDIATSYGISKSHLTKIVFQLAKIGYIESIRGKNGGIRLAKKPEELNLGEVLRYTESDFNILPCIQLDANQFSDDELYKAKGSKPNSNTQTDAKEGNAIKMQNEFCVLQPVCILRGVFAKATQAFIDTMQEYTLADITRNRIELKDLL